MKYAALFRGINICGKNIVIMADLKKLFADLEFDNARTYIQSGNIVFETDANSNTVSREICAGFKAALGFRSAVTLRTTMDEIAAIISEMPFSQKEIAGTETADPDVEHFLCVSARGCTGA